MREMEEGLVETRNKGKGCLRWGTASRFICTYFKRDLMDGGHLCTMASLKDRKGGKSIPNVIFR